MANIRVDVNYTIQDGSEIVFRSPVDCSAITGLVVYYTAEDGNTTSKEFAFADAHGNNVGDIDHLFAENVVVKVILDVTSGMAFVQNADTNAYLEDRFEALEEMIGSSGGGSGGTVTEERFLALEQKVTEILDEMNYTVDSELSETSTNPVQNRVITTAFSEALTEISDSVEQLAGAIPTEAQINALIDAKLAQMPAAEGVGF